MRKYELDEDERDEDDGDYLAEKQLAAIEDREYWHNRQQGAWAPADFEYDPLSKRGFE